MPLPLSLGVPVSVGSLGVGVGVSLGGGEVTVLSGAFAMMMATTWSLRIAPGAGFCVMTVPASASSVVRSVTFG